MTQGPISAHHADLVVNGVIGGAAIAAWLVAAVSQARRKQGREAAWSASLPGLAGLAGLLGIYGPAWHVVMTGLVAGVALRNAALSARLPRWLTVAGLALWVAAIVRAQVVFG